MRSQRGPLASAALTALPTSRATRIDPQPFPLSHRTCRCGRLLDQFGHHRAACSEARVFGRRGFPLECAAAQVCREGGARVTTNMFVRDMDLAAHNAVDNRRLEVVADRLTLWRGAQLAIDTTMAPEPGQPITTGGHPPRTFRGRRESSPRGPGSRSGCAETAQFLTALPKARAQEVPQVLQGRAETAWVRRWSAFLACTAARAFTVSQAEAPADRKVDHRRVGGRQPVAVFPFGQASRHWMT